MMRESLRLAMTKIVNEEEFEVREFFDREGNL